MVDWRVIGYEDGAKGRALSCVSKHRKACADYGIRPNRERYEMGRQAGLLEYCAPQNGFRLGRKGSRLNTNCPARLMDDFQLAWSNGNQLYQAEAAQRSTQKQINRLLRQQADLEAHRVSLEQALVREGINKRRRRHFLNEINGLNADIWAIEYQCDELEAQLEHDQYEVDQLRAKYLY